TGQRRSSTVPRWHPRFLACLGLAYIRSRRLAADGLRPLDATNYKRRNAWNAMTGPGGQRASRTRYAISSACCRRLMSEWLPVADAVGLGVSRELARPSSRWGRRLPPSARGCREGSL